MPGFPTRPRNRSHVRHSHTRNQLKGTGAAICISLGSGSVSCESNESRLYQPEQQEDLPIETTIHISYKSFKVLCLAVVTARRTVYHGYDSHYDIHMELLDCGAAIRGRQHARLNKHS